MTIEVKGDAHRILYDFLKYAVLYPEKIANTMNYDIDGFQCRVQQLVKAYDAAVAGERVEGRSTE